MTKKRILFVDDEPNVLAGLRRLLYPLSKEWDMEFANSGEEALTAMKRGSYDVVVSDMRMPGMNGAQLLKRVSELYPGTVRLILSGHSNQEMILQSVGYAHQYLAKPCDPNTLRATVENSIQLRNRLSNTRLHDKIAEIGSLPALPCTYHKLVKELQSETVSMKTISNLVSQDMGISAKVLQVVNSAFFGLPTHIENIFQAVSLLGQDTIRSLVLTVEVFKQIEATNLPDFSIDSLQAHCMTVGSASQKIAKALGLDKRLADDSLLAGMMHDVGKLVALAHLRKELTEVIQLSKRRSLPFHEAEQEVFGITHADIGAHLLSLWGLPDTIVEAAALHHSPGDSVHPTLGVLTAVHIANVFSHEQSGPSDDRSITLDSRYLDALGISDRLPQLREVCLVEVK
jgi:putative nucleotidyltransferase with HDIG domain